MYKLCPDVKEWIQIMISYEKKKNIYYYIFSLDVFSLSHINNTEKKCLGFEPRPLACIHTFYVLIKSSFTVWI